MGHDHVEVSDEYEAVENDDYAGFSAAFANGVGALEVSRGAAGHANSLIFEVFCENGGARFDQRRPAEIELFLNSGPSAQNGYRQVILGPEHPYIAGGLPMDARVSASARTTRSATQPESSSMRWPGSMRQNHCPAAPPSPRVCATWKFSLRSLRPQLTTESWSPCEARRLHRDSARPPATRGARRDQVSRSGRG